MKPNKQKIINEILIELEKGIDYGSCLAVNGRSWQLAERTFVRYWKEANEQYRIKQETINKAIINTDIELKKEVLKLANLTKIDRILIAENIAQAKAKKMPDGTVIMPSASDQLRALDYLAKINNDYAPTKTETELKFNKEVVVNIG